MRLSLINKENLKIQKSQNIESRKIIRETAKSDKIKNSIEIKEIKEKKEQMKLIEKETKKPKESYWLLLYHQ